MRQPWPLHVRDRRASAHAGRNNRTGASLIANGSARKGHPLMKTTITRLFDRYEQAKTALQDLIDAGVPREDISIVANASQEEAEHGDASQAAEGAGAGPASAASSAAAQGSWPVSA